MTEQTTDRLLLEDAARQARNDAHRQQVAADAQALAQYRQQAPERAKDAARRVLGDYVERGTWTATGGPEDYGWAYSAVAEIDGFRFLSTTRYQDYGSVDDLYLLVPCPNDGHEPTDRRVEVYSLAQLADLMDALEGADEGDLSRMGDCSACYFLREERVESTPPPSPTATERLVEALETVIEDRIGQRLDGFLSTYLPDRI